MKKLKNSEIAKEEAISTVFWLIATAFGLALILALGAPQLFRAVFTNPTPESTKATTTILTNTSISILFFWFSAERIKNKITTAIEHSAAEKFKIYQQGVSQEELIETQKREFLGVLCFLQGGMTSAREHREYNTDRENVLARQTILKKLSGEDQFLEEMSLAACRKVLRKQDIPYAEIESDPQITKLWQDLCFYLKAWLILSIDNGRPMPASAIKQRYPDQDSPDKRIYIDALIFIRDRLINHTKTRKKLGSENQELAINMIREYLDILIERIRYPIDDQ